MRGLLGVAVLALCMMALTAGSAWGREDSRTADVASGSLSVRVVGLPPGQAMNGVLRGPDGLRRSVSAAGLRIPKARPGVYRLTLRPATISHAHGHIEKGAVARPVQGITSVRVHAGHRASLVGTYGSIINPGIKPLRGGVVSVTGPPDNPTSVVLSGHHTFAPRAIVSMPPSVQLPRGLLSHVAAVSYRAGNTVLSLRAASVYEVAPNFQFNVPLQTSQATAADFSAGCGLPSGLSPYRRIKSVSFSGGWSTADVLGVHVTDGVRADVHFTVEAGLEVTAGAGLSCSLSLAFYANGLAGPIPVTASIEGDLTGSAAVGGTLDSGGSIEVEAGGHTVGLPPAMVLIPDVSFGNPHFTLTAQHFAQATAGIGLTVKAGVGVGGVANLTLNVGSSLDFAAQPGSCLWDAKFGQFSAEGELLDWHLSTPQTPALFTQQLGGNFCAASGSGGSGGTGGGPTPPPPSSPSSPSGASPLQGVPIADATAISAGAAVTCAMLADHRVYCWGEDGDGELGDDGGVDKGPTEVSGITDAAQITAGGSGPCAVLREGAIDCWGSNAFGEIGDGTSENAYVPARVSGIAHATTVSAGETHACALLASGRVECWGRNWLGQLGDDTMTGPETCTVNGDEDYACSRVPVQVDDIEDATAVAAGGDHTCALLEHGTVACWGAAEPSGIGVALPEPVQGVSDAIAITVGDFQTCALLADRHIDCWGMSAYGGLGDGLTTDNTETPEEVSGISDAVTISTGDDHTCAALADGGVDCWGENWTGDLGDGTDTGPQTCGSSPSIACSVVPVAAGGIGDALAVSDGLWDSCALLSSGSVECWGANYAAQLGDGSLENALVPTLVG